MGVNIEKAKPSDFDELKKLLAIANEYSRERSGLPLWTMIDYVHSQFKPQIERGECYINKNKKGEITTCIVITDDGSEWEELQHDNNALYFHKWMKHPIKSTQKESIELLKYVAHQAVNQNKKYLRCDTVPSLIGLLKYYERLGFKRIKLFVYASSDRPGILLEAEARKVLAILDKS